MGTQTTRGKGDVAQQQWRFQGGSDSAPNGKSADHYEHRWVFCGSTLTFIQYGNVRNEPGMGIDCTRAAMLIRIPPYHERGSGKTQLEFFWEGMESDATDDDEYVNEENPFSYSSGDEMDYEYDEGRAEDEDDEDDEGNEARPSHENDIAA